MLQNHAFVYRKDVLFLYAELILEDGSRFPGFPLGGSETCICEIVFNTSMTGYQELLTDPASLGQGIVMTYPLIGNYGINNEDSESGRPWAKALIVRQIAQRGSNFRCQRDVDSWLRDFGITAIHGVETRALTRLLRSKGTMNGMITCTPPENIEEALEQIRAFRIAGAVDAVSCRQPRHYGGDGPRVAVLDLGLRESLLHSLRRRGCSVTIFPARTSAYLILRGGFDGLLFSEGPGSPEQCSELLPEIRKLCESPLPVFGVGLGHQLMAMAFGGAVEKLPHGHRGGSHPVRDTETGKVVITAQNHGYTVSVGSLPEETARVSYVNINDGSVEGLVYGDGKKFSVQFQPESSPGPTGTGFLFDRFLKLMGGAD